VGWDVAAGFAAGLLIAAVTSPVRISGAVFLLPVQLSVQGVPSPAVTPTNLLFNVVSVPGALARYGRAASQGASLTRQLVGGTVPGVIIGAVLRVYLLPAAPPSASSLLFSCSLGCLVGRQIATSRIRQPSAAAGSRAVDATVTGIVGGIYGIGGGSLLAPILVRTGFAVDEVAPAALTATFITSVVGALTYLMLDAAGRTSAGPHWAIGCACGVGGLLGGYLGAAIQPRLPSRALRRLLGLLAVGLGCTYRVLAAP
jgi:uncharacterized membrane protein YfcA